MVQSFKSILFLVAFVFACDSFAQNESKAEPMMTSTTTTTTTTTNSGDKSSTTTVRKERKAELNFEDELVEGSTQKPELFYLFQKKNFNYKKLIKMRENFLPEMRRSTEDVQRVRGGN